MHESHIRQAIVVKLRSGALPATPPIKVWGGPARGQPCAACDVNIERHTAEIEVDASDGCQRAYHPACFQILDSERRQHAR